MYLKMRAYHNQVRTHLSLGKAAPVNRAIQTLSIKNNSLIYFAGNWFNTQNALLNTYQLKPFVGAPSAVKTALKYLNIDTTFLQVNAVGNTSDIEINFGKLAVAQNNIVAKLLVF